MRIDELLPPVLAEVPGCPDVTARMALIQAARELCRQSGVWQVTLAPLPLVDGQGVYTLEPPADGALVAILEVQAGAQRLWPRTMEEVVRLLPDWQTARAPEPFFYNAAGLEGQVQVFPTPAGAGGRALTIRASFQPVLGAATLPDALVGRYDELIVTGTKARLMRMPGKAWTGLALAELHAQRFQTGMVEARLDALHQGVRPRVVAVARPFGF